MTKNKLFIKAVIVILAAISAVSCDSEEQQIINTENINQAKINAENYIQNKYGFDANVEYAYVERSPGIFGAVPLSTVIVKMQYNNKEFNVYVDGINENSDGSDNYQQEEITSYLEDYLNEYVPNLREINIDGGKGYNSLDSHSDDFNNLYSTYFNGNNLCDVLAEEPCTITADYINTDFTKIADFSFLSDYTNSSSIKIEFVSYRSDDAFDAMYNANFETEEMVPYISNTCTINGAIREFNNLELKSFDDFYYYSSGGAYDKIDFSEIEPDDASCWNGYGVIDGKNISKAYSITDFSVVDDKLYIYYPISKINGSSDTIELAACNTKDKKKDFLATGKFPITTVGDYAVFRLYSWEIKEYLNNNGEFYFTFINDNSQ